MIIENRAVQPCARFRKTQKCDALFCDAGIEGSTVLVALTFR
jgi:hypothetical protein